MAEDKKISQLGLLAGISGTERIPVAHNGANAAVELQQLKDYAGGGGTVENLLRYSDGDSTSFILNSWESGTQSLPYVEKEFAPLTEAQLLTLRPGDYMTIAFELELSEWYVDEWAEGINQLPKVVIKFDYEDGSRQNVVVLAKVPLEQLVTGFFKVVHTFQLEDKPISAGLVYKSYSQMYLNAAYPSPDGAWARLSNPRMFKGKVDYGWVESTTYLTESIGNITDALIAINGPGKASYYHVGTNTAAYYDLGESFDGKNKYIEFDMSMEAPATSQYAGVFGVRNLDESGRNYCWSIRRLDTPSILWLNYSGVPMGEKVTFRFKGLELFANDVSLGAGTEYPSSTIENAYLFSIHDVGDPLPLYMSNLFKLYDVRIYSMDGTLLNNYEPQADQSRKCSITGKVLEKLGDGYFDVVKY